MTAQGRNRLLAVVALLVAGAGLAAVAFSNMGENLVYYWSPGEMLDKGAKAYGASIRLGGLVQKGSIVWGASHTSLQFKVADSMAPTARTVLVSANETPPEMFREGIGVVCEGTYDPSGVFTSNRLIVKHSNEYRAPTNGQMPSNWKEDAKAADKVAQSGAK